VYIHTQWAARLVTDLGLPGGAHAQREVAARVAESVRAQLAAYTCLHGNSSSKASASVLCPLALRVRGAGLVYEDTVEWDVMAEGGEAGDAPERFAMRTVADLGGLMFRILGRLKWD
jgi:hypothetical protein